VHRTEKERQTERKRSSEKRPTRPILFLPTPDFAFQSPHSNHLFIIMSVQRWKRADGELAHEVTKKRPTGTIEQQSYRQPIHGRKKKIAHSSTRTLHPSRLHHLSLVKSFLSAVSLHEGTILSSFNQHSVRPSPRE